MQRFFDVLFSALALVVLSPVLLPIIIILRLTGEGEVFYIQPRVGKGEKEFGLIKFASMLKNSPNIGAKEITLKDDPRILPFGKFLRKTKINELPQLINIIKGDISLVGPRPMIPKTWLNYPLEARKRICTIRPGLTGIGSIFFRDEEKYLAGQADPLTFYRDIIIPYKVELELWYLENKNLGLYFTIIFLTAIAVLFPNTRSLGWCLRGVPEPPMAIQAAGHEKRK
jgi:lipopolysaccharide/colanic/teichoic acid biosynthesis glycosyltransferase